MSDALSNILIPVSWVILSRVSLVGAQATISSGPYTFLAMSPLIIAPAILPAPMNPILTAMGRPTASPYNKR